MNDFLSDEQLGFVSGGSVIAPSGKIGFGIFLAVADAVIDFGTGFMEGFNSTYKG